MIVDFQRSGTKISKYQIVDPGMECNRPDSDTYTVNLKTKRKQFVIKSLEAQVPRPELESDDENASFFVADLGEVYRQYNRWKKSLPKVKPFFAVKCNPDREVIRLLALLGCGFDCSSRAEIKQVLDLGVGADRIIFANPYKSKSDLRYAQQVGIKTMTFDGSDELYKIKAIFPEANLILRIAVDDSSSINILSEKFGAPMRSVKHLCLVAKTLGLDVVGISFHVGSGATDPQAFTQAVQDARISFDHCIEAGHSPQILDVGGGFSSAPFEKMAQALSTALEADFVNDVDIIAEPGRYFVETAFTLACNIIARRSVQEENDRVIYMLYLNDGVYSNFLDFILSQVYREPFILSSASQQCSEVKIKYTIWGRTCCGMDLVAETAYFDRILDTGDWLYFEDMGAYSLVFSSGFNGHLNEQIVHHICSEAAAATLLAEHSASLESLPSHTLGFSSSR